MHGYSKLKSSSLLGLPQRFFFLTSSMRRVVLESTRTPLPTSHIAVGHMTYIKEPSSSLALVGACPTIRSVVGGLLSMEVLKDEMKSVSYVLL